MRDCPQCNAHVDGLQCPACGYREPGARYQPARSADHFRCCDEFEGRRCSKPGTLSTNNAGDPTGKGPHPGPWFCAQHFPAFRAMAKIGERTAPPGAFNLARDIISGRVKVPRPEIGRHDDEPPL